MLLLLVLLVGVVFAGYHSFMPAKWVFGIAEFFTITSTYDEMDAELDRLEERHLIPLMEQPFSRKAETAISVDEDLLMTVLNVDSETAAQITEMISSFSIRTEAAADFQNLVSFSDFTVDMQGNPFLGMNVLLTDEVMGLQFPDLSKTRLKMDLTDPATTERLAEITGSYPDPSLQMGMSNPWISKDIYDKVGIDRAELRKLVLDYAWAAYREMPASAMSIEGGMDIDLFDEKTGVREITIDMTPEQTKDLLLALMEKLETDDRFYRLFVANLDRLLEIIGESSPELAAELQTVRDEITPEQFGDNLKDAREAYGDEPLEKNGDAPKIAIKAYVKGYKMVRHAISVVGGDEMPGEMEIGFDRQKSGDNIMNRLYFTSEGEDERYDMKLDWANEFSAAANTQNRSMDFNLTADAYGDVTTVAFALHMLETPNGKNEVTRTVDGLLRMVDEWRETDVTVNLEGEGPVEKDAKGKTLSSNQDYKLSMAGPDMPAFTVNAKIKTENTYGGKLVTPTDSVPPLDVATATDEDLQTYAAEVMPKLQELMGSMAPGME